MVLSCFAKRSRATQNLPPVFNRAESFFAPKKTSPAFYIDATAARVDDVICQKKSSRERIVKRGRAPIIFNNEGFLGPTMDSHIFRLMKSLRRLRMTRQKNPKIAPLAPSDVLSVPPGYVHTLAAPSKDTEINNRLIMGILSRCVSALFALFSFPFMAEVGAPRRGVGGHLSLNIPPSTFSHN